MFLWQALSQRDRAKETSQNYSEKRFQDVRGEGRELLGNIDLQRREATKKLVSEMAQKLLSGSGRAAAEDKKAMTEISSTMPSWEETNRAIICSWVSLKWC